MAMQLDEVTADAIEPTPPAGPRAAWWRRVHWGAVLVVLVAAGLRWWWLDYARPQPVSDFAGYLDTATNLVDRGFLGLHAPSAWRLPAFPAFLALGMAVSRDVAWLSAWTAVLSVAQVVLTYRLAWLVFGLRSAALLAAAVAAITPAFVLFAPVLASEHLLAVLVLAALIAAMEARHGRWWTRAALAGLLTGAAVLTRAETVAYAPAIALVVVVGVWTTARDHRRVPAALGAAAVVVVAVAVVVAPWVLRNERVIGAGAGLSTTGGFNFYVAHSPGDYGWRTPLPLPLLVRDEVVRNDLGWRYGMQYVRDHPDNWAPTIARGTSELLAPSDYAAFYSTVYDDGVHARLQARDDLRLRTAAIDLAGTSSRWLLWAGLAGLVLLPVWRIRAWLAVTGIVLANWVVYAVVFWAQARYRFVVDALACVAVGGLAAAVSAASSWVRDRRRTSP